MKIRFSADQLTKTLEEKKLACKQKMLTVKPETILICSHRRAPIRSLALHKRTSFGASSTVASSNAEITQSGGIRVREYGSTMRNSLNDIDMRRAIVKGVTSVLPSDTTSVNNMI